MNRRSAPPYRIDERWLARWAYLSQLVENGRWGEAFRITSGGAWRAIKSGIGRRSAREVIKRHPDARSLDARVEMLDGALTIIQKPCLSVSNGGATRLASIIIPCFNYGRFVREAVDSAAAQTLSDIEIIVVDDGSEDPETVRVLDSLEHIRGVRVIHQMNAGLPSARNAGIAVANGEFICCLDADDTLEPTYLECCIAALESDHSLGFAYSHIRFFGDENRVLQTLEFDIESARRNNHVAVTAVFRRDDAMAVGGFDPAMSGGFEDWEFWLRLASAGRRGYCIKQPLFNHRRHGRTMTHIAFEQRASLISRISQKHSRLYLDTTFLERLRAFHAASSAAPLKPSFDWMARAVHTPIGRKALTTLVPSLPIGGSEQILRHVLADLSRDYEIEILTTSPIQANAMQAEFEPLVSRILHLPTFLPEGIRDDFVIERLRQRGGTMLISGSRAAYGLAPQVRAQLPGIHIVDVLHNASPHYHLPNALRVSASINAHIAGSKSAADALCTHGVPSERIFLIKNGVDHKIFHPTDSETKRSIRGRFGIPEEVPVLGFVGRMSEEKRPLSFLEVVARVGRQVPVHAIVVGDGPLAREFDQKARTIGASVTRLSYVQAHSDLADVYATMDLLVLPSSIEGLPLTVLEAHACGIPVVACDVGDVSTVVRSGVTGVLVPSSTPLKLVDGILALLRDPMTRATFGAVARENVVECWTLAAMVTSYRKAITGAS